MLSLTSGQRQLGRRILFTFAVLALYRLGSQIPLPGVSLAELMEARGNAGAGTNLLALLSGGAYSMGSLFALGVLPYVTASIVMQLLGSVFPRLQEMQKDPVGKKRYSTISRTLAIVFATGEGVAALFTLQNTSIRPQELAGKSILSDLTVWSGGVALLSLVAGFLAMLWMARLITQRGIGNGMSVLLIAATVSGLVPALKSTAAEAGWGKGLLLLAVTLAVTVGLVALTLAERRIPVVSLRSARSAAAGDSAAMALRPIGAGVAPVIFGSAVLGLIAGSVFFLEGGHPVRATVERLLGGESWVYYAALSLLIVGFTYLYTAVQINTLEVAEELERSGMVLDGQRAGMPTVYRLAWHLARMAVFGGVVLALATVCAPLLAQVLGVSVIPLLGTGLLILVSTFTDAVSQYRAHQAVLRAVELMPAVAR